MSVLAISHPRWLKIALSAAADRLVVVQFTDNNGEMPVSEFDNLATTLESVDFVKFVTDSPWNSSLVTEK